MTRILAVHGGDEVVRLARAWLGTPYHHQSSRRGIGTDCLGLVRGVWRDLYGFEAELPPAYSRDWAEASHRETMIEAAHRNLVEIDVAAARDGDVLLFRLRPGTPAKHAAIRSGPHVMIHAMEGNPVAEVALGPWWSRRVAAAFAFPGTIR